MMISWLVWVADCERAWQQRNKKIYGIPFITKLGATLDKQLPFSQPVFTIGCRHYGTVRQSCAAVHPDVPLHAKVPLLVFACRMQLIDGLATGILGCDGEHPFG
jgi:hypothetical protein